MTVRKGLSASSGVPAASPHDSSGTRLGERLRLGVCVRLWPIAGAKA